MMRCSRDIVICHRVVAIILFACSEVMSYFRVVVFRCCVAAAVGSRMFVGVMRVIRDVLSSCVGVAGGLLECLLE